MIRTLCLSLLPAFVVAGLSFAEPATPPPPPAATQPAEANDDPLVFADTVWLDNGTIKLGVSLSVGRITWFGFSDGQNLLWVNPDTVDTPPDNDPDTWINYGGDKIWSGPQPLWPFFYPHGKTWPPDGHLDGEAWTLVSHDEHIIHVRSPVSPLSGLGIARRIGFSHGCDCCVVIDNTLTRSAKSRIPVQPWNVSQVVAPQRVYLNLADGKTDNWLLLADGERFDGELTPKPGYLLWEPNDQNERWKKLGSIGSWIVADYGDFAFTQWVALPPDGSYPENSSVQLYVADDYVELETLGPIASPGAGESVDFRQVWNLKGVDEAPTLSDYLESADTLTPEQINRVVEEQRIGIAEE